VLDNARLTFSEKYRYLISYSDIAILRQHGIDIMLESGSERVSLSVMTQTRTRTKKTRLRYITDGWLYTRLCPSIL